MIVNKMDNLDCTTLDDEELIEALCRYEGARDQSTTKEIYKEIIKRDRIGAGFWREVYADSANWIIDLVTKLRQPRLSEIVLVRSNEKFKELVTKNNIDMGDYDGVMDALEEENDTYRINLIREKRDLMF
jgi:hypothetical protein